MKASRMVPKLSELQRLCGKIREGRWVYEGMGLQPYDQRRPVEEILAMLDTRKLDELFEQARNPIEQMQYRAHCGDIAAITKLAFFTRGLVTGLEKLAVNCPDKVQAVAQAFATWPINLSLNPQEITRAKDLLKRLTVGTKAPTPTRPGQRVDPRNFWTLLAKQAFDACDQNRVIVTWLEALSKGAHKERRMNQFWGTRVTTTLHTLANGEIVVITDWQKRCVKLSEPITIRNFSAWSDVVKACVLQHWKITGGQTYEEALKLIGSAAKEEWQQRSMALDRVKQALRSLVGVQ